MAEGRDWRRALESLRFDWAVAPDDVWERSPFHVEQLHDRTAGAVLAAIDQARAGSGASPLGLVIEGQRGSGKTHMLGWVREQATRKGGYFFLVGLYEAGTFWEAVTLGVVDGLLRVSGGDQPQVVGLLSMLAHRAGLPAAERESVTGAAPLRLDALDALVGGLRRVDRRLGQATQDTLRALALYASPDDELSDLGYGHLTAGTLGDEGAPPDERARWNVRGAPKQARLVVRDLSHLLALTGPTVVAVDQVDTLLAQSRHRTADAGHDDAMLLDQVADGLMTLRQVTRRTLSLLACLPESWERIKTQAVATVADRFREASQLHSIPSAEVGRELVEKRFGVRFRQVGFVPPYATWPVRPEAFEDAPDYTPRNLLRRIDRHVEACLARGEPSELARLDDEPAGAGAGSAAATGGTGAAGTATGGTGAAGTATAGTGAAGTATGGTGERPEAGDRLRALDDRFSRLRREAEVAGALDPAVEDEVVPRALAAGLAAWVAELGEPARRAFALDPLPGRKPALHARLRQTLDETSEHEAHWAFRAIGSTHGNAALARLRAARTLSGIEPGAPGRRLVLLRNTGWSQGLRTQEELAAILAAGGEERHLPEDDLRTFAALEALVRERPEGLDAWLVSRRPAGSTELLAAVLGDVASRARAASPPQAAPPPPPPPPPPGHGTGTRPGPVTGAPPPGGGSAVPPAGPGPGGQAAGAAPAPRPAAVPDKPDPDGHGTGTPGPAPEAPDRPASVLVGLAAEGGRPVRLPLESLRRHTAIFAGSGSGKTVLIRRLVEDCALQGVSAIVLDPNNDLARLGDAWPTEPRNWLPGDPGQAARYLSEVEVVVWTPGREAGNPLAFQPLPDFAAVLDDPDEFEAAVEAAVAVLAPRARVDGRAAKAELGRAVLKEALRYFAEAGHGDLDDFVEVLGSLPAGVSAIADARRIGANLAQLLRAAMVNDPLFGGHGAPAEPGLLLTPSPGRRARVSVVNFAGLPADEQRQSFVNQLQMALFAWVKAHPAAGRPLGGLFVMDEAQALAPSGEMTACTRSTLTLASQARKYGLGLVFATQAPKGLHNRIAGNAFTQLFGYLNSPTQIAAANEMARAKGSRVPDISRVDTGEFFISGEGVAFHKVRVPNCLSHHPPNPLTTEEVLDRARRGAATSAASPVS